MRKYVPGVIAPPDADGGAVAEVDLSIVCAWLVVCTQLDAESATALSGSVSAASIAVAERGGGCVVDPPHAANVGHQVDGTHATKMTGEITGAIVVVRTTGLAGARVGESEGVDRHGQLHQRPHGASELGEAR